MYGLPADFNSDMFVCRTIEQVCFTVNQIAVHFDDDLHLVIGGDFSLRDGEGAVTSAADQDEGSDGSAAIRGRLTRLLHARVVEASASKDGTLILECVPQIVSRVVDASPLYESYSVSWRGQTWVV